MPPLPRPTAPPPHGHVARPRGEGEGGFHGFAPPTSTPTRPPSSYVHVALEPCCLPVFHRLCYPSKAILTILLPPPIASNAKPLINPWVLSWSLGHRSTATVEDSWNSHCQCRWLPSESPPRQGSLSHLPGLEVDEDDNHLAIGLTTDGFDQPIVIYENLSLIVKVF